MPTPSAQKRQKSEIKPLLFSRSQAAARLGVSVRQIERMEKEFGLLTAVRLTPSPTAHVFYKADELARVAEGIG